MTPEERDLRRALDARSGEPTPQFQSRLASALAQDRPAPRWRPALAIGVTVLLAAVTVGVLLLARHPSQPASPGPAATTSRIASTPATEPIATPTAIPTAAPATVLGELPPAAPVSLPTAIQLSAPSGNAVWALVEGRLLFRSTDQGTDWERRPMPPNLLGFPEISFVDDREGWLRLASSAAVPCQSDKTTLWHTADGGATWDQLSATGIGEAQCKAGISFVDAAHGFIGAWDQTQAPVIYQTSTGGRTWTASRPLSGPPGFSPVGGGSNLRVGHVRAFGALLLVTAQGADSRGQHTYVYQSFDGGGTWDYVSTAPDGGGAAALVTSSRWIQLLRPGQSFETIDAGAHWRAYAGGYSQAAGVAPDILFGDSQVGYASVRGAIQRTRDGGNHWEEVKTPGT